MLIKNAKVLDSENRKFEKRDLLIENGVIEGFDSESEQDIFDAEGLYVIPGFIDTHIHGCVGVEFASPDEDFTKARSWLASEGTTSFAATVRALDCDRTIAAIENILRESNKETNGASVEGINLEGPFVSLKKSGVMNPPDIECNVSSVKRLAESANGMLKIMTIAPERENASSAIETAVSYKINASIGHTDATYSETIDAINAGATRATHVFNAMRPFSHRETGVLGAVLTDDRVNCEMICDLVHLDAPAINLVYKSKGFNNITLISDTGAMSGLGDGDFVVNGVVRTVKNGICRNPQGVIAGSCYSMYYGAKNLLKLGIPLEEISVMASLNPAKALGCDNIMGSIRAGNCADLIICDKELNIEAVFINGKKV